MRLYLITDDSGKSPEQIARCVSRAIDGGVTAVQFREKNCGPTLCERAYRLVSEVCLAAGVPLFLNADLLGRFAMDCLPQGIHYSNRTLPVHPGSSSRFSGYSAHAIDDAASAFRYGVNFCTISPVFHTPSKAGILDPVGTAMLAGARAALPSAIIVALGGITAENAQSCIAAGADGIAVIRSIMQAEDPAAAARTLRRAVENSLAR